MNSKLSFPFLILVCFSICVFAQKNPTFEEVISLKSVSSPRISPNGKHVVFEKSSVDWKENRFDSELWISKNGKVPFQLTNNPKGSSNRAQWSPDGKWIAYLSNHSEKTQIQVLRLSGGAPFQVTNTKQNIFAFEWSPDGKQIAFLQSEDKEKEDKKREDKFGAFAVEDEEYSLSQLWITDFKPEFLNESPLPEQMEDSLYKAVRKATALIDSVDFTITGFKWSPDGKKIVFNHQPNPLINSFMKSDISIYHVETKEYAILVNNESSDFFEDWSPDGKSIVYTTNLDDNTSNFYKNSLLFRIDIDGKNNKQLAKDFDENIGNLKWLDENIVGIAWQKTNRPIVSIDPETGNVDKWITGINRHYDYSITKDGRAVVYTGNTDSTLTEIYVAVSEIGVGGNITNCNNQIKDWDVANSEMISWKSKDGTTIEGALFKPQGFDSNRKYPLMVVIHGGPTGISVPSPVTGYVYPVNQWLNKGALVLMPNYRGSAGYGEKFRSLNVKNLGVGDAWDVISGVEHLVKEGMVHADSVSAMGWSQGGYISAFLTTNSDKFKAISVGAGISNWMTYYVNTDIHPFTRQYLKATPWSDKAIYEKTSPMTNINNAKTPTLIQHGEFDKRVPPANAFELFQGLQDLGVETKLVIYKGFGHGITKPKERLAAVWHNWQWFGKYIWGEEIELPTE